MISLSFFLANAPAELRAEGPSVRADLFPSANQRARERFLSAPAQRVRSRSAQRFGNIIFYAATVFSADFTNKYRAKQGENGFLEVFAL